MSCDSSRGKLWKKLGLNDRKIEALFYQAKQKAQTKKITDQERADWERKTTLLMYLFDYYELRRPVHSKSGLPRVSSMAGFAAVYDALKAIELPIISPDKKGFTKTDAEDALALLGQKALEQGTSIKLVVVGGIALMLAHSLKRRTHDIDAYIVAPEDRSLVRKIAASIGEEKGWRKDWLNEGAKGYLHGFSDGGVVYSSPGIEVTVPSPHQLLAMKLSAWRTIKDEIDASVLLKNIIVSSNKDKEETWKIVESYLIETYALKARYAFEELWEVVHGSS